MVRIPRIATIILGACTLLAHAGCRSAFDDHRSALRSAAAQGRWEQAAVAMDDPVIIDRYGQRNRLLWLLDRGTVAQAMGDHAEAIETLNAAEDIMDRSMRESIGDVLGALLINDSVRRYTGEPYEDIYVNVIKMLAHLEAGAFDDGATIEARRIATKANLQRDRYLKLLPATRDAALRRMEDAAQSGGAAPGSESYVPRYSVDLPPSVGGVVAENKQGEFIESTLGLFLTAAMWMHFGEAGNQRVAAERLVQTIDLHRELMRGVDPAPFAHLASADARDHNLLLVATSGLGPTKTAFRFPPLIIDGAPIYFELPIVRRRPSAASSVRAIVNNTRVVDLALVEDLGQVAEENHRRALGLTYLRTIARAAAKAIATRAAVKHVERRNDDEWVRLGVNLAGLLVPVLTERADLRAWETLPGQAHGALVGLPPGEHTVRLEWVGPGGRVVDESRVFSVRVEREGEFRAVVARSPR